MGFVQHCSMLCMCLPVCCARVACLVLPCVWPLTFRTVMTVHVCPNAAVRLLPLAVH